MNDRSAVLSVDLEFFTHTPAYRQASGSVSANSIGIGGVEYLLEAFNEADYRTTFFVVSDIADHHPELLEKIDTDGHEIGSHTHRHHRLSELSRSERQAEISDSRERLSAVVGQDIDGFRAPVFDLPTGSVSELCSAGYDYDSSVLPARRIPGFYPGSNASQRPGLTNEFVTTEAKSPSLRELPVSVMPTLRLPLSGAWLRLLGLTYTRIGMRWLARRGIAPILYVHPWELVDLPRVSGVPERVYWRTGRWMRRAIDRLLNDPFQYTTARTLLDRYQPGESVS